MLALQRTDDSKINVEIKVPPFAEAQTLEVGQRTFGLPRPKLTKSSGGNGGATEHEVYAHVPAEVGTVLAFYRRELAARNWKEETQGADRNPGRGYAQLHLAGGTWGAEAQSQIRSNDRKSGAANHSETGCQS